MQMGINESRWIQIWVDISNRSERFSPEKVMGKNQTGGRKFLIIDIRIRQRG